MGRGWIVGGSVVVPVLVTAGAVALRVAPLYLATPRGSFAAPRAAWSQAPVVQSTSPELSPDRLFARVSLAVAQVVVLDGRMQPRAYGSGFFVTGDGLLVTNFHVIQGASFATVRVAGLGELTVDGAVAVDPAADLALLKIRAKHVAALRLGDDRLPPVGTKVFAVGSPEGLTNTLSEGLVSGIRVQPQGGTWIQTSAPISHGSSGGPLVAADGTALGVTSAFLASGQNLNFAVPIRAVWRLIRARGPVVPLSVASVDPSETNASQELRDVWDVITSGQFNAALDRLAEMRNRQASNPDFWYAWGYVSSQVGAYETAATMYQESIRLKPDNQFAYLGLGLALESQNRLQEALRTFGTGERLYPDVPTFYYHAGLVWMDLGDNAHAIKSFARAAEVNPDDAAIHRMMGQAYFNLKQFGPALDAFDRAIKIDPNDVDSLVRAGDAHRNIGEYNEAKGAYLRAVSLAPNNPWGYLGLGWAYYGLQDYPDAAAAWRTTAKLDAKGPAGAYARQDLVQLYYELGWR